MTDSSSDSSGADGGGQSQPPNSSPQPPEGGSPTPVPPLPGMQPGSSRGRFRGRGRGRFRGGHGDVGPRPTGPGGPGPAHADRQPRSVFAPSNREMRRAERMGRRPAPTRAAAPKGKPVPIPPVLPGRVRIIPLGGVEEVGRNMTAIETSEDILVVDAGFQFKEATTPGIDYILPNTRYLEDRKDKVRALFITHGHLDHIGGVPYILDRIGHPAVYTRRFGAIMVAKRHEEFPHLKKPEIVVLDGDETVAVGTTMKVETFAISHTIPDSMGLIIQTPVGEIAFIEDVRVDNVDGVPTQEEEEQYKRFKGRNIVLLTMDSTSIEKPGFSISESTVVKNIERFIKESTNRLIIATFASQVERVLAIINAAFKYGKKVCVEGRSMKNNVEIVKHLGLLKNEEVLIPATEVDATPPDRLVMLVTGAQGEEFAALMRMANKTHKTVTLKKTDTVLLSSSIIPTNYSAVVKLKDTLYRSEAKVITYLDSDIHASGHGNREELRWIHEHIDYKFFMPVHGNHYMLRQHAELAHAIGVAPENVVVPDNGSLIEIHEGASKIEKLPMKAPNELVTVDGFAVGESKEVVLRDRQALSESGIFVVFATVQLRNGELRKSPDIISRGFVYLRESQELLRKARFLVKRLIETEVRRARRPIDFDKIEERVSDEIGSFLFQETAKQPLVITVITAV
ncbi:MAG TPA: ribonuclease J [Candidatus Paceibacterota bacterium]